jgi:flavin-dependent dehydrogenase
MKTNYDVIVVGAGIVGSYFARRLAERGCDVLLLDRRKREALGGWKNRGHNLDTPVLESLPIDMPTEDETLAVIEQALFRPIVGEPFLFDLPMISVRLREFTHRINREATDAGVTFLDQAQADAPLIEGGAVVGVSVTRNREKQDYRAKVVADVSGVAGVIRSKLPPEFGFPSKLSERDYLLVYSEDWEVSPEAERPPFTYHEKWQGWSGPREPGVVGIGLGRFASRDEDPRDLHKEYSREVWPHGGKRIWKTFAKVPLRHPLHTLVGNGVLLIGDSACQGKPLNGEGVSVMLQAAELASEVVTDALANDDVTTRGMWDYNTRYHRDVGARFSISHRLRYELLRFSDNEMSFMSNMQFFGPQELSEIMGPVDSKFSIDRLPRMLRSAMRGAKRPDLLFRLGRAARQGQALKKRYEDYPSAPSGLGSWAQQVDHLYECR